MEFELTESSSIKTLARVIQGASKIGDDLMVASAEEGVQMRTLNASHSTCAQFIFRRSFFERLTLPQTPLDVKVPARALLPIFRSAGLIASVRVRSSARESALTFTIRTLKTRLKKTFRVPILEGRLGVTVFSRKSCTCMLQTHARFFLDVLANFHGKLDEITFTPSPGALRIASFVDDVAAASASNRMLRTEMVVDAREFEVHRFTKPDDVVLTIFCRYFRAMLEFCDHFERPVRMCYEASGMPLLFDIDIAGPGAEPHFQAQFVFATRHVEEFSPPARTPSSSQRTSDAPRRGPSGSAAAQRTSSGSARGSTSHVRDRPRLAQNSLPPLPPQPQPDPDPDVREPAREPVQVSRVVAVRRSPSQTQSQSRQRFEPPHPPLPPPLPPPIPRATALPYMNPESGPSHVSDTPEESLNVDDEIRPGPLPATSPIRKPKAHDPRSNGVTPIRKRRMMFSAKTPQSGKKGDSHDTVPDESIPDTPVVDPESQNPARTSWSASPSGPNGTLFETDTANAEEEYEDDDDYVAGTPPPE